MFSFAWPASATAANVVPNPGFEQGGCGGSTPIICGWVANPSISQDTTNPHSGSASLHLDCGVDGCYGDPSVGGQLAGAGAYSASCAAIGPGLHPASFWYRDAVSDQVEMDANFFQNADCTGSVTGTNLTASVDGASGWHQADGAVLAPTGTQSVSFNIAVSAFCVGSCALSANFDDLDLEDAVLTTPHISSFAPTDGPAGTSVDIQGANFSGATSVMFNGTGANFTVDSDSAIHATVPNGATTGPISVMTPSGTDTSSTVFTVLPPPPPPPTIASFTPTSGAAGTTVDIRGTNFTSAGSVRFASSGQASFTIDSDSEIHAIVPDSATTGPISVVSGGGTGTSSSTFTVTPTISSVTPASGPVGTEVTIRGTGLTPVTSITFNGFADPSFVAYSPTYITTNVPAGATTGPISVTTPYGAATSSSSFSITPPPGPTINSLSPTTGPVGTRVDIHGTEFSGATNVSFNGTADPSFVVNSATEITATVPSGATTGPISVTGPGGTATSSSLFTVTPPPTTITGFSPSSGHAGQQVTITGSNLTGATSVMLGTTSATFAVSTASSITAVVPSIARGYYTWSVTTPAGTSTSTASFRVK
jgi:hypothetical protein